MKKKIIMAFLIITGITFTACSSAPGAAGDPETKNDTLSYALGADVANNMKTQGLEINPAFFNKGFADAFSDDKEPLFDKEEVRDHIMRWQKEMREKMMNKRNEDSQKNLEESNKFLEENKEKEGVKTTDSGLQYKIIKEGTGKSPSANSKVKVHYVGRLIDGTEFDSSIKRGNPNEFRVNGVIPGWTEALQMMKEGGKWEIYIPSDLAYGPKGAGQSIGPNQALIFEVELLEVMSK